MSSAAVTIIVELRRDVNTKLYDREVFNDREQAFGARFSAVLEDRIRAGWALSTGIQLTIFDCRNAAAESIQAARRAAQHRRDPRGPAIYCGLVATLLWLQRPNMVESTSRQ
jgi:hypothetical protein